MFKRIAVTYSESPEARRALTSAVYLAKTLGAELQAVTILHAPPAYTAYAEAVDPSLKLIINSDRMQGYERLYCQYSNGRCLAIARGTPQRWGIMSLDGQVLVIGFFAVALKLLLWSREETVGVDVEPDRKDVLHLDDSGPRLLAGARPDGAEGIVTTALRPRLERQ
jgi:hypothetical protein